MKIQTQYLTTFNSYPENTPTAIIVHNTDNFSKTATAKAHAEGLKNGYMQGMSWHVVVDDKEAYQCLPYNRGAWHIGVNYGNKTLFGKINNRNSVCVEMCVNAGYDYEKAFQNTVDVVKQLMAKLKIPADKVYQHYDICNKYCPSQIRKRGDWNRFKSLIVGKWYRVRKTWKDEKSQLGAYQVLQNAKENCPVGYSVFDESGKAIYTPVGAVSSAHGKKYPSGVPTSKEAYIEAVGAICRDLQAETGILASVVTAQCCLETGFGLAADCKVLMDVNNLLGMKTDLIINNTWEKWTIWSGSFITKKTPEYHNGKLVYITDQFRAYPDYHACILDYEQFLLHVRNGKGYKYASVRGMTDPAAVIRRIRIGTGTPEHPEGYCTDPNYETKVLNLIKQYNLSRFDLKVSGTTQVDRYEVGHVLNDPHRLGMFHELENAKALANKNWGYKVYDIVNKTLVYAPKLTRTQEFVAEMVYIDALMKDDLKAGKKWKYRNKNTSKNSKTFDDARAKNNRYINCVSGVQWALIRSGAVPSDRKAIQWYGNRGIVWCNSHAEADAKKYFHIIDVGKTVKQAIADGTLQPGDIITYKTLAHTNAYIGNGIFFDSGHAYCSGSGEGAEFKAWTGSAKYNAYKVAKVLRLK